MNRAALVKAGLCSPGRLQGCCTCSQGHCCCRTAAAAAAVAAAAGSWSRAAAACNGSRGGPGEVRDARAFCPPPRLPLFRLSSTRSRTAPSEHDAVRCMTLARACLCHVPCLVLRPCEHQCSAHPPTSSRGRPAGVIICAPVEFVRGVSHRVPRAAVHARPGGSEARLAWWRVQCCHCHGRKTTIIACRAGEIPAISQQ